MTDKELEKIRKRYVSMVTSPKFMDPPKTQTEAMIDWIAISIAIEDALE